MKRTALLIIAIFATIIYSYGQGESSTYFNIFVPPNAEAIKRNVCLVVTAVFDDTTFEIIDDGMDGDTDDSKTGTLSRGQSYILYIADNGINDDARYASGGVLKQDGDYFIIHSNKNVLVSQSTNSDWQHDFVPAIGQKGIGERFFVYAPQVSSSRRDLNAFVYEDSTLVTIKKISMSATTVSGYTNVNPNEAVVVGTRLLNRGQDIIYFNTLGRDVMETGHTYLVEATKPITLQYGALYGNERDGGGNVPSSNGSASGELFYFGVPYQSGGEQEIRIISWDDSNAVKLERYSAGSWITVKTWNLNRYSFSDWVGKSNGNVSYPTVFRVTSSAGKRVSVFEANWLETGNPGTSDIGSMMTSEDGTSAGQKFITYMAPPGNNTNVRNPFTGSAFGQQLTHLYISSRTGAQVTVKDAYTGGAKLNRTFTIAAERYVDCYLTLQEWKNIYNGTGTPAGGPERPYLIVESDQPISIFNTNFNDNWMSYLGTAQKQEFSLQSAAPRHAVIPGDTSVIRTQVVVKSASGIDNASATLQVEGNVTIVSSTFVSASGGTIPATLSTDAKLASFSDLPSIDATGNYTFNTTVSATITDNQGKLFMGNSVGTITTQLSGTVGGTPLQAVSSDGIFVNSANVSQLMFTPAADPFWNSQITDSWTVSLVDYDNDNRDDIFIAERAPSQPNYLYRNNGDRSFTRITGSPISTDVAITVAGSWADIDNDGDLDLLAVNNTQKPNALYLNNGNGTFTRSLTPGFVQQPGYYHSGTWVDYDNDGLLDLFLCNYWPTKLNELWHNDGNGNFSLQKDSPLSQTPGDAVSATWTDYDNDGLMDVFLPNNKGKKNILYHNDGHGAFTAVSNSVTQDGGFSVASCWGDIDGNGYADLFVANASGQNNFLYLNRGGIFQKVTTGQIVLDAGNSHGCSFADVDNDGDLDLYVNDDANLNLFYINLGDGTFSKLENETIAANYGKSMGHAWSDLDRDGDLDLLSVTHSGERDYLFWNNGNSNHWLQIRLQGLESNRCALGARLRLKANGKWSERQINGQSGIGGQGSYRCHFGLASSVTADSLVIFWPSGTVQTLVSIPADQHMVITEQPGKTVSAQFFADANGNCVKDADEAYLGNQLVRLAPHNIALVTDATGKIRTRLSSGTYTMTFVNSGSYNSNCTGSSMNLTVTDSDISLGELGMTPVCQCSDATVTTFTTAMRRGFGNDYHILISNEGSRPTDNLELRLTVPSQLTVSRATPAWSSQRASGATYEYTWNLPALPAGGQQELIVRDSVTLNLQIGNEVVVRSEVSASAGETNLSNNSSIDTYEIVGAIDPNMIIASPLGFGKDRLLETGEEITYRILFENIGNYATSFVTVTDTLSSALDLNSISDIVTSHGPVQTTIQGRVVTFFLPSAEVPPSSVDTVLGHGFIQFKIRSHLDAAGALLNRASIVFDYSEPIITNTVRHTLFNKQLTQAGALTLFPNPAQTYATATIHAVGENSDLIEEITVLDARGIVRGRQTAGSTFANIDVSQLPPGLYIVSAQSSNTKIYTTRLVIAR